MLTVTGQQVADFLGEGDDAALVALAGQHVGIVDAMVRAYTRGGGYDETGEPNAELAAVITTATARLVTNPEQTTRESVGGAWSASGGFHGWSLAETFVLNRYRRRSA